jgi:hypothetical protein
MLLPNPVIKINGIEIHNPQKNLYSVVGYTIHSTFMQAAGTFDIEMTDLDRDRVFTNDRVEIILDNTTLMKGLVDEVTEEITNTSVSLKISGRDYAGWWLSSDAEPKTYKNSTDNAIIVDMLQQGIEQLGYGLPLEYDLGTSNIIKEYIVSTGKSFYDCWAEIANINDLYMHFDNNGVLRKMKIASTGLPVDFFDLDNNFEGYATITRSISEAKSDVWIQGRVSTVSVGGVQSKDNLSSLLASGPNSSLSSILTGKKSGRQSGGTFLIKQQRPDNLHRENRFRTEARSLILAATRDGSTFRRRIITTRSKRLKSEADKEISLQFDKTAPTFEVRLTLTKLYNIVVNDIVRLRYKDIDTNLVVHTIDYSDYNDKMTTVLSLKLPGRIR